MTKTQKAVKKAIEILLKTTIKNAKPSRSIRYIPNKF